MLGWVKSGRMVRRTGARSGDLVQVSGPIGDGWLGLQAARGELAGLPAGAIERLAGAYRLPNPRLDVSLAGAGGAADVSDGLIADAGHIAAASRLAFEIELSDMPLSPEAAVWLGEQPDRAASLIALATGGDDYQIVATARSALPGFTVIGRVSTGRGVRTLVEGVPHTIARGGYLHGNEA